MKNIISFCFISLVFTGVYSQKKDTMILPSPGPKSSTIDTAKVYTFVQTAPQFPGDIKKWLGINIKYPEDARKNNIEGTVFLSFIIEKDGSVSGVSVLRSVNSSLDNEAKRVIALMPKWTPGIQEGKPVRVQYRLPIRFELKNNELKPNNPDSLYSTDNNYRLLQEKPRFPGDVFKWLAGNLKYPEDARKNNIQGTVYVKFIIENDGSVTNAAVIASVVGGDSLDKEALRVVNSMPNWIPAQQDGHPVRTEYTLPIRFKLGNNDTDADK
jgi:TonB family protein